MPPAPKLAGKLPERTPRPRPRLHSAMACDSAFRVVARSCLRDLTANQPAAYRGDPKALHQMRIALTRLRTTISFFSPMVADLQRTRIRSELKWLQAHLGAVRDLDVAIERLREADKQTPARRNIQTWEQKRAESHRHLARALRTNQVSAACREHIRLDRERPLVHEDRKASHAQARSSHRFIQRVQTGAMGREVVEEEP